MSGAVGDEPMPEGYDPEGATVSWNDLYREAVLRLQAAGIASASIEAARIAGEAAGLTGAEMAFGMSDPATVRGVARFDAMLARRLDGEPLQYVLGSWGFRHLDLMVDRRVLIPRPETEQVVGAALTELDRLRAAGVAPPLQVADLGTGSGAIALSIAHERTDVEVWATDRSAEALEVARANLAGIGRSATRVRLAAGAWFDALPGDLRGRLDLLISNPPYVAAGEELPAEVRDWEPAGALVAGPTGREDLEHLVAGAPQWLAPHGVLVLELAPHQAAPIAVVAERAGFAEVEVGRDYSDRDRWVVARLRSPAAGRPA